MTRSVLSKYAAALGISSVLFLWGFQVFIKDSGIPFYLILFVFLLFLTRITTEDVFLYIFLNFILFVISLFQAYQGVIFTTPLRSFSAIPVYCFAFVVLNRCVNILRKNDLDFRVLFLVLRYFLFTQILVQGLQLILWMSGWFDTDYKLIMGIPRTSGYFFEPSHLAFSLSPFIYLFFVRRKLMIQWIGKSGVFCVLFIYLLCPSTTVVGIIGLALLVVHYGSVTSMNQFVKRIVFSLAAVSSVVWLLLYVPALNDRVLSLYTVIDDPSSVEGGLNASSLAFYKGYEMAYASLRHFVLGVGFLNFQFLNEHSSVSLLSELLYELNKSDGTTIGFKVIGEYGYLGLFIMTYAIIVFVKNIRRTEIKYVLENAFIFGLMASCLRGASYFDGPPFLAFVLLFQRMDGFAQETLKRFLKPQNAISGR